jgi:hypothetical protein
VPLQVLPAGTAESPDRFGWFRELVAGLMVLARRRALRIVVMVDTAVTITSAAFLVVEPLYARHVVHRPPAQFALFEAAAGIGSMVAGLALSCIKAQPTGGRCSRSALPPMAWPHACSSVSRPCRLPTRQPHHSSREEPAV